MSEIETGKDVGAGPRCSPRRRARALRASEHVPVPTSRGPPLTPPPGREEVVLLDEDGRPVGTADKATVHGPRTPRHLAFSCYGYDTAGRVLVTRRAAGKRAFPLVWTGTCCGHPAPGEPVDVAVRRRLRDELGVHARDLTLVLPGFSYRASDGTVEENELCPVYVCRLDGDPAPAPDEVAEWVWWDWDAFLAAATALDSILSPWARLQAPLLDPLLDTALPGLPRRRTA
jgi:isopentenyl-diphosphate Delta-isomerase